MELMKGNNLNYGTGRKDNVFATRSLKSHYPFAGLSSKFRQGDDLIFDFPNSPEFIDSKQSFLVFKIKCFSDTPVDGNQRAYLIGSVLNIFRTSITQTKYKKEIDRIENLNLLNYDRVSRESADTKNHILEGLILSKNEVRGILTSNPPVSFFIADTGFESDVEEVAIPLKYLSSVFCSDKLLPPQLYNGMRINLELEKYEQAFTQSIFPPLVDTLSGYEIFDIHLRLDSYKLDKTVFDAIDGQQSIPYHYTSYYTDVRSQTVTDSLSKYSLQFNRSMSLAQSAQLIMRDIGNQNNIIANSFASSVLLPTNSSMWRAGQTTYPNNKLTGILQHYMNTVYTMSELRRVLPTLGMSLVSYRGGATQDPDNQLTNYGHGSFSAIFKRHCCNKYSGIKINDDHPLTLDLESQSLFPQIWVTFIEHLRGLSIEKTKINLLI